MLKDNWALITGASAGIGRATAEAMAAQGCNLILLARRQPRLQELAKRLQELHGIQSHCFAVDLQSGQAIQKFLEESGDLLGRVEILVNNAGLARSTAPFHEVPLEELEEMIHTNVLGLIRLTRGLLPQMLARSQAHIVNLGSVAGRWSYPGGSVYCASKFAVRALSEGLRMDLLGRPVRVTNIEPGMVDTEFSEVRLKDKVRADQVYEGMTPLQATDVAETILWCLNRPAHVNVQELVLFPTDQAGVGLVARRATEIED